MIFMSLGPYDDGGTAPGVALQERGAAARARSRLAPHPAAGAERTLALMKLRTLLLHLIVAVGAHGDVIGVRDLRLDREHPASSLNEESSRHRSDRSCWAAWRASIPRGGSQLCCSFLKQLVTSGHEVMLRSPRAKCLTDHRGQPTKRG